MSETSAEPSRPTKAAAKPQLPIQGLHAQVAAVAAEAQRQGDYQGYALLSVVEIDLGKLRLHLAGAPSQTSAPVAAIVEKLKALI